jgi:anaerobic magnesium-protoporphyrin IX monomethyl ester cyclase
MRTLLLCGLGPAHLNSAYLDGTLFDDAAPSERVRAILARAAMPAFDLFQLEYEHNGQTRPLLMPRHVGPGDMTEPHLTTLTIESILEASGHDHQLVNLEDVWSGTASLPGGHFDVALLSTTYIWSESMLARAIGWVQQHAPGIRLILGGQYTNLTYLRALANHRCVLGVIRGDSEESLPAALDALDAGRSLDRVPNLVWRDGDRIRVNPYRYVDIDTIPAPRLTGTRAIVPYESMRGCPFDCKFCSYPLASPKWRYRSAEKIREDWTRYTQENDASLISAMDSTFTVPPTRLRRLMEILPGSGIRWEGFSRANVIKSAKWVEDMCRAHCHQLTIGFESMSDRVLRLMSKRVNAKQNRRAHEVLREGDVRYAVSFMVGYPGETPADFAETGDFLANEFEGRFNLQAFSIKDETMPLWRDREELGIVADDLTDTDGAWSHVGMTSDEASTLQWETLDRVRTTNDRAVCSQWRRRYQYWLLMPHLHRRTNLAVEKCIERLAMAPRDHADIDTAAHEIRTQMDRLAGFGVTRPSHGNAVGAPLSSCGVA